MIEKSYITKQSLTDACNAYLESPWANDYGAYSKGVRDALRTIKDCAQVEEEDATIGIGLPSADVVEVVHGRWIFKELYVGLTRHECSECHSLVYKKYNYCPHCGARMDDERKDGAE